MESVWEQQDKGRQEGACILLVQDLIEAYANLLVATSIKQTFEPFFCFDYSSLSLTQKAATL